MRLTFESLVPVGRSGNVEHQARYQRAVDAGLNWVEQPEGWLVLFGPSGCGKTHLAAAIANACLASGQPCFFMSVPDLLDHLRSTFTPQSAVSYDDLFEQVRTAPILILDDLGTQSSTPWAQEKLFQILNYRYSAHLPTVITSSASLEELDERTRSRIEDPSQSQMLVLEEPAGLLRQYQDILELPHLRHFTFENFRHSGVGLDTEQRRNLSVAYKEAFAFAQDPDGWLVFQGHHGCGKTHLAAAIGHYRRQSGQPALFVVVADLLDHLRSTFGPDSSVNYDELFEQVRQSPLLMLDDLGAHTSSPWALEKLYQILNYRYNARLATVITTSLTIDELDDRFRSRILDLSLSTVIGMIVPSYMATDHRREEPTRTPSRQDGTRGPGRPPTRGPRP